MTTWRTSSYCANGQCVEVAAAAWQKSSYCPNTNGQCVEIAWQTSSYCDSGTCVEVAPGPTVRVRDTTDPDVELRVPAAAWRAFLGTLRED